MYKVKYFSRDKFIGEENFTTLEKAEDSLYRSTYSTQGDYYEVIDSCTGRIIREFPIPALNLPVNDYQFMTPEQEESIMDWPDWMEEDL